MGVDLKELNEAQGKLNELAGQIDGINTRDHVRWWHVGKGQLWVTILGRLRQMSSIGVAQIG